MAGAAVLVATAGVALGLTGMAGPAGGHRPVTLGRETAFVGPVVDARAFHGYGDLAFVSLGGLYVLDGSDNKVAQLVPLGGGASDPQFSPNGKWLTFSQPACAACFELARANGTGARRVPLGASEDGRVAWLPDSQLLIGDNIGRISATGQLVTVGQVPSDLVAWSAGWDEFVFETSQVRTGADGAFNGHWVLQMAGSLTGKRTVWYRSPISFNPASGRGFQGNQFAGAEVLPHHEGVLFSVDPGDAADNAGGFPLYWLAKPGGQPQPFGRSRQGATSNRDGVVAIATGGNVYAWMDKQVEICDGSPAHCSVVKTPPGELSFDAAWSPRGNILAFVEAKAETAEDFLPSTVVKWYSTHHLFLLSEGSSGPVEVRGTQGAASPVWSANGKSLLYVADNSLWLLPHTGASPVRVASPLLVPSNWGAYFGQINWTSDFAWSEPQAGPEAQ